jgi:leucyl-tRNA synthetase
MKDAIRDYPVDVLRFLIAYAGDTGIEDANMELREAKAIESRILSWHSFATEFYGKGISEKRPIDEWFEMIIDKTIETTTGDYSNANTKSALQSGFFNLGNTFKWYRKRAVEFNKETLNRYIEVQTKLIAPITPHICEEIWSTIGKQGFIAKAAWPVAEKPYDKEVDIGERIIESLYEDMKAVVGLSKLEKPNKIFIVAPEIWKYDLAEKIGLKLNETRNIGEIIKTAMSFDESKKNAKSVQKYLMRITKSGMNEYLKDEQNYIESAIPFFEKEFGCKVELTNEPLKEAWPGKFGIVVE